MIQRNFKLLQVFSTRYVGFELIYKPIRYSQVVMKNGISETQFPEVH